MDQTHTPVTNERSVQMIFRDTLRPAYLLLAVYWSCHKWHPVTWPTQADALLGGSLTVGAVIVGFLISANAILISHEGKTMKLVKDMGLLFELADNFRLAVYISMAFIVVSTYGFFKRDASWFEPAWMALAISMMYSFFRITNILYRILRN